MKIAYLPIESYRERYTELLQGWTTRQLEQQFGQGSVKTFYGYTGTTSDKIRHGRVLDTFGRSAWSLGQMRDLVLAIGDGAVFDAIYIDDMFTPGYEALAYINAGVPIFARNHAQSVDVHDFTFQEMMPWMRHYEHMVASTAVGLFCASTEHKQLMQVAGYPCSIHVVGLPFDAHDVRRRAKPWQGPGLRPRRCVYSSRWDAEKRPQFFLDVVERMHDDCEFVVCTGADQLRGDYAAITRAMEYDRQGWLKIMFQCTKEQYFSMLACSRAHFLCSLQDWVSYSMLDASALGTPTLAPCYRSFPEALGGDPRRLYTPWNVNSACFKLREILDGVAGLSLADIEAPSLYHSATIERIAKTMRR